MIYAFIIFLDGSYVITTKYRSGSLTWTIENEDIVEKSGDIEKYATRKSNATYMFATYGKIIRGLKDADNIHNIMIDVLFKHENQLRSK